MSSNSERNAFIVFLAGVSQGLACAESPGVPPAQPARPDMTNAAVTAIKRLIFMMCLGRSDGPLVAHVLNDTAAENLRPYGRIATSMLDSEKAGEFQRRVLKNGSRRAAQRICVRPQ